MGSLLPGWDDVAPGVAPKEFQDFNEQEEELGYFASYSKMKKQREAGDLSRTSAPSGLQRRLSMPISLARNSMPSSQRGEPHTPSSIRSQSYKESPTFGSFKAPPHLQRLQSMPVSTGDRFDVLSPKGSVGVGGSPHSPSLEAYKTQHDESREVQWWRNFDSAHLNEMPDVPETKERGFIPQYKLAGQKMHYRGVEEEASPTELQAAQPLL